MSSVEFEYEIEVEGFVIKSLVSASATIEPFYDSQSYGIEGYEVSILDSNSKDIADKLASKYPEIAKSIYEKATDLMIEEIS